VAARQKSFAPITLTHCTDNRLVAQDEVSQAGTSVAPWSCTMLRVLPLPPSQARPTDARLQLVGQVSGSWVTELRRVCDELLAAHGHLEIDMTEVSFVDADGLRLFDELTNRIVLVNCALFVAAQLKTLEQDA
jgi:ABC-type transporter Mla MlaB component